MFIKAEIWTVGRTGTGMAALLRMPGAARCVPVSVEPAEAQLILTALSGVSEKPPGWVEFMQSYGKAVQVTPESVEILKGETPGLYRAVVHFSGKDSRFSLDARAPEALALAIRCSVPIFLDETISEEDSIAVSMAEPDPPFSTQLNRLRTELGRRVDEEDYEQAAGIRDRIRQIEERMRSAPE